MIVNTNAVEKVAAILNKMKSLDEIQTVFALAKQFCDAIVMQACLKFHIGQVVSFYSYRGGDKLSGLVCQINKVSLSVQVESENFRRFSVSPYQLFGETVEPWTDLESQQTLTDCF